MRGIPVRVLGHYAILRQDAFLLFLKQTALGGARPSRVACSASPLTTWRPVVH